MPTFDLTLETKGRIYYDYKVEAESLEEAVEKLANAEVEFTGKPRIEEYDLDPEDVTISHKDKEWDGYGNSLDDDDEDDEDPEE